MAHAQKAPGKSGIWAGFADFGLHGIALYGLATGLAIDYGREAIAVAKIDDAPLDPPATAPAALMPLAGQVSEISPPSRL